MILRRRPWPIYDVDVAGLVVLLAVAGAGWWLAARPWQRMWGAYTASTAQQSALEKQLEADRLELTRFERELAHLGEVVDSQADQVPAVESFALQLRRMTTIAEEEQLSVLNVTPQPAQPSGPYLVTDVTVGAHGSSRQFMRFLDRLAQANPHQGLRAFSITGAAGEASDAQTPSANVPAGTGATARGRAAELCELNWTVRFYLLPALARGGPP
ncbi:MAG: hypothetical protein AB1716_15035 [Planctomycetota bacterium]